MPWFEEKDDCVILNIRVIPCASKDSIQGLLGDALKVRVQAPPIEGKANTHLIRFLSKQWNIPRANFELLSGKTGRNKQYRIKCPTVELRKTLLSIGNG